MSGAAVRADPLDLDSALSDGSPHPEQRGMFPWILEHPQKPCLTQSPR